MAESSEGAETMFEVLAESSEGAETIFEGLAKASEGAETIFEGLAKASEGAESIFEVLAESSESAETIFEVLTKASESEKGLASAGERKANDRNGATESVACLSRKRVCNANSGMKGESSEAGAALTFWFFWVKPKEQG